MEFLDFWRLMSEERPKKKRYEGLIQFKDSLRQSIVCLQASMEDRFLHSLHSAWIRKLDEEHAPLHHLIFAMGRQSIGEVNVAQDMTDHHLLARICQQQSADLCSEIIWAKGPTPQLTAWLDPSDFTVSSLLFRMISLACDLSKSFDLKTCMAWGGVLQSANWQSAEEAQQFLRSSQKQFGLSESRVTILKAFLDRALGLLQNKGAVHFIGDGLSIGILIEGSPLEAEAETIARAIAQLPQSAAHTILINRPRDPAEPLQLVILTSIRASSHFKGASMLKGFVLINNIRPLAKPHAKSPQQAS